MVIHDVVRRKLDVRSCEECDTPITVNAEDREKIDQHHVVGFTDGSGGAVATEYATYIFCSLTCYRDWSEAYLQRMLENEESGVEELQVEPAEHDDAVQHSEG